MNISFHHAQTCSDLDILKFRRDKTLYLSYLPTELFITIIIPCSVSPLFLPLKEKKNFRKVTFSPFSPHSTIPYTNYDSDKRKGYLIEELKTDYNNFTGYLFDILKSDFILHFESLEASGLSETFTVTESQFRDFARDMSVFRSVLEEYERKYVKEPKLFAAYFNFQGKVQQFSKITSILNNDFVLQFREDSSLTTDDIEDYNTIRFEKARAAITLLKEINQLLFKSHNTFLDTLEGL